MSQTQDESTQNWAERLCWEVARRDDGRVARRLYRKQLVDGVYRRDEGALLDDVVHFLQAIGVMSRLEEAHGAAVQRQMVPFVQYLLLYGLKTLFGMESMKALPPLLLRDAALRQLVGFNAQQVRQGICQRGATQRQGERPSGPIGPATLAKQIVKWNVRDLEAVFTGRMRALAHAGVFGAQVTGMADGTDLETTDRDRDCGPVTRKVRIEDKQRPVHEIEVTVYGGKVRLLLEAATKMPLAVKVGQIQEQETHWTRALVTQARAHLAGHAHRQKVVFDQGLLDGTELWWLDQQGLTCVVPAKTHMAVTADARAQAMAGEGITVGRRVPTVRHGQGRTARRERLARAVVGIAGLTTDDHDGTPEHGRQANRRDFQANPRNAVVVRTWPGRDYGPGGNTVFRTNASVQHPLQPCDDDADRSLIETCGIKAAKQQWQLGHPPQKTERAVRGHVLFTLLLLALATGDRLPCEREARGGEPVGWQRWRRQLLAQTRDQVIVFAQGYDGLFHLVAYSLLLGVKRKDVPPGIGTYPDMLAKSRLSSQA
jgi:hypothetical protein